MGGIIWTADLVDELTRLWAAGDSATQIAYTMGGVSRNAVLGKVHRLKLPERAFRCLNPVTLAERRETRSRKDRARHAASPQRRTPFGDRAPPIDLPPAPDPYAGSLNIPMMDLRPLTSHASNQCRFIHGAGPEFLACANPTSPGQSWCGHCAQIVWTPPERRRAVKPDSARRGMKASNFVGSYEFS